MFWDRFYNLCIDAGTKPNAIRDKIGVSSGVITKWKNDQSLPSGESLRRIADYLDCSVDYLLGRTDNPKAHLAPADMDFTAFEPDDLIVGAAVVQSNEMKSAQ